MPLPLSSPLAARLDFLEECGSTNTELVGRAADAWPHFSVVATANQTAGRGRLGRVWVAPPGQTLAVSVLLRPTFSLQSFGWLPLIAGLAMARAVSAVLPPFTLKSGISGSDARTNPEIPDLRGVEREVDGGQLTVSDGGQPATPGEPSTEQAPRVAVKWPNDVLVDDLKVAGLLAEMLPTAGVVLGAGLNLTIPADGLPTPNSTSLMLKGAHPDALLDRALAAYLGELRKLYDVFAEHGGDAEASGIRRLVLERCSTIGQQVRVELPGGETRFGVATGIDALGRLTYTDRADGSVQAVAAGDVTHLRYE